MGGAAEVQARLGAVHGASRPSRVIAMYEEELLWARGLNMAGLLRVEWKRAMTRWQTWIAFAILLGFCFQGLYAYYRSYFLWDHGPLTNAWALIHPGYYNAYLAFINIFSGPTDFIVVILPLLVAVAASDSLAWDRKTGFVQYVVNRSTMRRYIVAKIVSASMVGAAMVLGASLIAGIAARVFFPVSPTHPAIIGITPMLMASLYAGHPLLYCFMAAGIAALSGMAWALLGVLLSTLVKNVYLVIAGPWLLFLLSSFPALVFAPNYAPLSLIGPYIDTAVGHGVSPGYPAMVPLAWIAIWMICGLLSYVVFTRHATRKGIAV